MSKLIKAVSLLLLSTTFLFAQQYTVDASHSHIGFKVAHMVISKTNGEFKDYSVDLTFNKDDLSTFNLAATIQMKSVDTGDEKRDDHLRNEDFFDVNKYPTMTFKSSKVEKTEKGYIAHGQFTLHGVTKNLSLPFTVTGPIKDPWGNTKMGVELETEINRKEYGITWSKSMDGGGLLVGDEVYISINLELALKK